MALFFVVDGGKRERYSLMGSSEPRAFRGLERDVELLFLFSVVVVVVPFLDGGGVGGLSCPCWMVVRKRGWIPDQYGSGS